MFQPCSYNEPYYMIAYLFFCTICWLVRFCVILYAPLLSFVFPKFGTCYVIFFLLCAEYLTSEHVHHHHQSRLLLIQPHFPMLAVLLSHLHVNYNIFLLLMGLLIHTS